MVDGAINQISLFDFDMFSVTPYVAQSFVLPSIISYEEDMSEEKINEYLYHGERVLSLLREKKVGNTRFLPCDFLERFNVSTYVEKKHINKEFEYVSKVAIKQAREMWERNDSASVSTNILLEYLSRYLLINAAIGDKNSDAKEVMDYFFRKSKTQPKGIIAVQSVVVDDAFNIPAGKGAILPKNRHLGVYRLNKRGCSYCRVADAANLFWKALLVCVLKEQVLASIEGLSETELNDNILYRYITDQLKKNASCVQDRMSKLKDKPIAKKESIFKDKAFVEKVITNQVDIQNSTTENEKEVEKLNLNCFILSWFLSNDKDVKFPFEILSCIDMLQLCELLEKVCDIYDAEKQSYIMVRDLKQESAKVYQTKKNISLKCQKAMVSSGFNKYFGYVEIDDECDLEKFCVIEQQFKALSTTFFHGRKDEEVSIRFRKLGRHHAAGLYYPYIKCLAVDVRNTDSLSHEYFHMLDYESGRVSRGFAFSKIRERYRMCLMSKLDEKGNEELKENLMGNSKYNLSYYLAPTEIFARCAELYLTKIKGIDNSLVKPDKKAYFAYPEDDVLLELIKDYFDEFLKKI